MLSKGIGVTHYLILLCGVLAISALPAAAQQSKTTTTQTTTVTKTDLPDLPPVTATGTRVVGYGQEMEFDGRISRIDGDIVGVVDSSGAETAVLMVSGTRIKSSGKRYPILVAAGSEDRSALFAGLPVRVEGRGNCAGQLVAEVIKYHCCEPCGCARPEARALGETSQH
jgi:hypothetical protein